MTAHIRYKRLDDKNSATHSKFIIKEIIRRKIGFNGILFSDDLCMKALKGSYFIRAKKAIDAGCDIVLHCEPNLKYIAKTKIAVDDLKVCWRRWGDSISYFKCDCFETWKLFATVFPFVV